MDNTKLLKYGIISLIVVLVIYGAYNMMKSKSQEGFSMEYYADEAPVDQTITQQDLAVVPPQIPSQANLVEGRGMSPPNLAALPVSPRSNLPGLNNGGILGDSQSLATQAAPPQPVMMQAVPQVDFSTMGGAAGAPFTTMTSQQAEQALKDKVGGGAPVYQEATLPLADIGNMSTDPTNPMSPENFMYTRTIFAPLKRQYANGVDMFRGDIDVAYQARGWFDVRPPTDKDIVTGYFNNFLDIQQETAVKDAQWTRATPVQTLYNSAINTAGDTYRGVMYSV